MISANEGWSVSHPITGDHANIWHTTDGGKNWKQQGSLFRQLNAVAFAETGGATWTLQRDASHPNNLLDVSFADLNNGWAVGGEQLRTIDGGATWATQNTGVNPSFSTYAVSPTTAWIGGIQDLARTTDGGATWTIERPSDTAWFCLSFLDANTGWAGGQDQAIDDGPGSIWKRSGSVSAPANDSTTVPRSEPLTHFPSPWQIPPSGLPVPMP